ncbi:hypothetical protein [Sphingobacterium sp. SGR-19]|nr:hypothetical protein [Sphingobacterium sp. SGR-19]
MKHKRKPYSLPFFVLHSSAQESMCQEYEGIDFSRYSHGVLAPI